MVQQLPVPDDSHLRSKRASMDFPNSDRSAGPPPSASAKLRSFLGSKGEPDEAKKASLRKRLSSASGFFTKNNADEAAPAVVSSEPQLPPGAAAPNGTQTFFPTLFPENFSLSNTASPEAPTPRRGSVSWQPSYPTVVDDAYADIPPDGFARNGVSSPTMPSENARRRSAVLLNTPSPEELSAWPAMQPSTKNVTPPQTQTSLPTPPSSAVSPRRSLIEYTSSASPELSLNLESTSLSVSHPPSDFPRSTPTLNPTTPAAARGDSRPMPLRRTTLIQSPPMPQPIKNLPTMTGWSGFNQQAGGAATPGWGALAREGGPKTPGGFGSMANGPRTPGWAAMSPGGPKTPGLSGFPFSTASLVTNNSKEKKSMSEEELRRARRAMVSQSV